MQEDFIAGASADMKNTETNSLGFYFLHVIRLMLSRNFLTKIDRGLDDPPHKKKDLSV